MPAHAVETRPAAGDDVAQAYVQSMRNNASPGAHHKYWHHAGDAATAKCPHRRLIPEYFCSRGMNQFIGSICIQVAIFDVQTGYKTLTKNLS